jgi:hypothetical protein
LNQDFHEAFLDPAIVYTYAPLARGFPFKSFLAIAAREWQAVVLKLKLATGPMGN